MHEKKPFVVKLKPVSKNDYRFLYGLLKERNPHSNISHKKMPSLGEHEKFIKSKPYFKWYIIYKNNQKCGSVYLSKINEIGIHFKKKFDEIPMYDETLFIMMEKHPKKRYLANVNPSNLKLIRFYVKHKFELIQYTYELMI